MKSRKIQRPILAAFVSLFLFLAGTAAIATSSGIGQKKSLYEIAASFYVDGKKVSSPHVITQAGNAASIIQSSDDGREYMKMAIIRE